MQTWNFSPGIESSNFYAFFIGEDRQVDRPRDVIFGKFQRGPRLTDGGDIEVST